MYRVRVGDWDTQVPDVGENEYAVETVYFHEQYNVGLYLNNDIAVVRVAPDGTGSGFRFGTRVRPACLPQANVAYAPGIDCTVTGWGSTGIAQGGFARYLQVAESPSSLLLYVHQSSASQRCLFRLRAFPCSRPRCACRRACTGRTSWAAGCTARASSRAAWTRARATGEGRQINTVTSVSQCSF